MPGPATPGQTIGRRDRRASTVFLDLAPASGPACPKRAIPAETPIPVETSRSQRARKSVPEERPESGASIRANGVPLAHRGPVCDTTSALQAFGWSARAAPDARGADAVARRASPVSRDDLLDRGVAQEARAR